MTAIKALLARLSAMITGLRKRYGRIDQLFRAATLYSEVNGGRLSAAAAYFAFLAVFPLLLLVFSVLGFVFQSHPEVTDTVARLLADNLPILNIGDLQSAKITSGLIGLVGLFFAGLGWVDAMRASVRYVWGREQAPGNVVKRKAFDAAVLLGIGLILAISLGASVGINAVAGELLSLIHVADSTIGKFLLGVIAAVLGILVSTVLFIALLSGLPRLRMGLRRLFGPALLCAVGLEIIKTVGVLYIDRTQANPAYQVVTVAVGLLVFFNLLHQLILFSAAITACSRRGEVFDLMQGSRIVSAASAPVDGELPATLTTASQRQQETAG